MLIEKSAAENEKIAFVNSSRSWGGGEKWHFDISRRLYEKAYDILLISSPGSELNKRAVNTQIPGYTFRITNLSFLNPIKIIRFTVFLKNRKIKVLIINLSADLKFAGIAGRLAGIKKIIYRRGSALPVRNTLLNRFLFRRIVNVIIANSEETKRTILLNNPRFVSENKIKVIYNGLDLKSFDSLSSERIYRDIKDVVLIGNAGRLSEEKGQFNLVDMATILKSKGHRFKILIAGEGKLESKLRGYALKQGVGEEIILLGFIEDIRSFIESIDIFVLTSSYEGFGYVLVEAMAGRKPVVAFDISSSAEIVENGKSGFLVEKGDVNQLADRVALLMNDPGQRKIMGTFGRRRVEEYFTIEKTLSGIENLINSPDES
jgi:glycosyltransferase involved in cell wall biosynthesis